MKTRAALVLCVLGLLLALAVSGPWSPNLGLPFGYYGELNRVKRAIDRTPGLMIVGVGVHEDISLEDFWITIRTSTGRSIILEIFDGGAVRDADDRADGLFLVTKTNRGILLPFADGWWSSIHAHPITTLEELLPHLDAVLTSLEREPLPFESIDSAAATRYVRYLRARAT